MPPDFPSVDAVRVDWTTLFVGFAMTLADGVISGLVPAVKSARRDLLPGLREGVGASTGRRTARARRILLVSEAVLAVMLLVASMLVGRSFVRLLRVDPGYDAAGVLSARVYLPGAARGRAQTDQFLAALIERLRAVPGVHAAGAGSMAPFSRSTAATD